MNPRTIALIVAILMGVITVYALFYPLFIHGPQPTPWQVGPGRRGGLPAVKGYSGGDGSPTSTIKQEHVSVFCLPVLNVLAWYDWCVW